MEDDKVFELANKHEISGYSGDDAVIAFAVDLLAMDCWISCDEQMPKEKERVLCVTRRGIKILSLSPAFMGIRNPHPADWVGESVSSILQRIALEDVTNWMPLPSTPKVKLRGCEAVPLE